ncbi:hypothetical protein X824_gp023 [Escherichia phage 4MG]|uniref:Hyphothetical protein n=1 Tax=Escherichia phage 4MG TaxID=1391428 RepID=V5KSU6_9CAUD|nr:hypothetical protein X824_gp023 [Escherichia phage 4MG]AGZ17497.1 hyphothetical protein [Escherichia phage 4MG]
MSKHTPGPWSNDGTEVGTGILHEIKIAKCCLVGYEETRANARLIAASPEMLELLELSLPYLNDAAKTDGHAFAIYNKVARTIKRFQ